MWLPMIERERIPVIQTPEDRMTIGNLRGIRRFKKQASVGRERGHKVLLRTSHLHCAVQQWSRSVMAKPCESIKFSLWSFFLCTNSVGSRDERAKSRYKCRKLPIWDWNKQTLMQDIHTKLAVASRLRNLKTVRHGSVPSLRCSVLVFVLTQS